jgi:hypothetical protein
MISDADKIIAAILANAKIQNSKNVGGEYATSVYREFLGIVQQISEELEHSEPTQKKR